MINACVHFSEESLGELSPWLAAASRDVFCDGELILNGVSLPQNVINELRRLGITLSWYSAGELQDAVIACSYDSNLIDDEAGCHFRDKLQLTDDERTKYASIRKYPYFTLPRAHREILNFCGDENKDITCH